MPTTVPFIVCSWISEWIGGNFKVFSDFEVELKWMILNEFWLTQWTCIWPQCSWCFSFNLRKNLVWYQLHGLQGDKKCCANDYGVDTILRFKDNLKILPSTSRSVRDLQSSTLLTIAKSRNISSEILFWSKIKLFQKFERERLFLWKALNLRHNKIWLDHVSNLCCTNTNLDLLICKKIDMV